MPISASEKPEEASAFNAILREFGKRPQIYGKISAFGLGRSSAGGTKRTLADYRPLLDRYFDTFGADRVFGGAYFSQGRTNPDLDLMREYLSTKPRAVAEKFFWKNSLKTYKWVHRAPNQPRLA